MNNVSFVLLISFICSRASRLLTRGTYTALDAVAPAAVNSPEVRGTSCCQRQQWSAPVSSHRSSSTLINTSNYPRHHFSLMRPFRPFPSFSIFRFFTNLNENYEFSSSQVASPFEIPFKSIPETPAFHPNEWRAPKITCHNLLIPTEQNSYFAVVKSEFEIFFYSE